MQLRRAIARLGSIAAGVGSASAPAVRGVHSGGGVSTAPFLPTSGGRGTDRLSGATGGGAAAMREWVRSGGRGAFAASTGVAASRGYAVFGSSTGAPTRGAGALAACMTRRGGGGCFEGLAATGARGDIHRNTVVVAGGAKGGITAWGITFARGYAKDKEKIIKTMKVYKPTSPGIRGRVITLRDHLWKGRPYKPLTVGLRKKGGRNNHGRITVWHRGGGHKRLYRMVDFKRMLRGVTGTVRRIEYDPNRTTRIALVDFDGKDRPSYILAVDGMKAGDTLKAGDRDVEIRPGNALPLEMMPAGTLIHNIELRPGQGGKLVRAAGATATLIKKGDDGYATVKLPSGEQRLVLARCYATVGVLSNREHKNRKLGKAGAKRWLGIRPTVRGVAMNPVDHPHGGGEGRTSGGRPSCTPWGVQTKGKRTRNNKKTDVFRVSRRPSTKKTKGKERAR